MTGRVESVGNGVLKGPRCYEIWVTDQMRVSDQCPKRLVVKDVAAYIYRHKNNSWFSAALKHPQHAF